MGSKSKSKMMKLKKDDSRNIQIEVLNAGIRQFENATSAFEIGQTNLFHTKGIKFLMETGQCAWLIMRVATTAKKLSTKKAIIKIEVKMLPNHKKTDFGPNYMQLTYRDNYGTIIWRRKHFYGCFTIPMLEMVFRDDVLYLPNEC